MYAPKPVTAGAGPAPSGGPQFQPSSGPKMQPNPGMDQQRLQGPPGGGMYPGPTQVPGMGMAPPQRPLQGPPNSGSMPPAGARPMMGPSQPTSQQLAMAAALRERMSGPKR
jgi:hypothetical protein